MVESAMCRGIKDRGVNALIVSKQRALPGETRVLDKQYLPVKITGESEIEATYSICFTSGLDIPFRTEVHAEVLTGGFSDDNCNGTGKVSMNIWVFVNGIKGSLHELSLVQHEFKPPPPDLPVDIQDIMILED